MFRQGKLRHPTHEQADNANEQSQPRVGHRSSEDCGALGDLDFSVKGSTRPVSPHGDISPEQQELSIPQTQAIIYITNL